MVTWLSNTQTCVAGRCYGGLILASDYVKLIFRVVWERAPLLSFLVCLPPVGECHQMDHRVVGRVNWE